MSIPCTRTRFDDRTKRAEIASQGERQRTTEMNLHILALVGVGTLAAMVLVGQASRSIRPVIDYHRVGDYWLAQHRRQKAEAE